MTYHIHPLLADDFIRQQQADIARRLGRDRRGVRSTVLRRARRSADRTQ